MVSFIRAAHHMCTEVEQADQDITVTANERDFGVTAMQIPLGENSGQRGAVSTADIEPLY